MKSLVMMSNHALEAVWPHDTADLSYDVSSLSALSLLLSLVVYTPRLLVAEAVSDP